MRAAVLYEPKTRIAVENVDIQKPKTAKCWSEWRAAGICHSDLHVVDGFVPAPLPVVMGHEGAGVVEEVGAGVTSAQVGDHVILVWRPACGTCYFCQKGRPGLCEFGTKMRWGGTLADGTSRLSIGDKVIRHFGCVSTFGEYSVVPQQGLVTIRKDIPLGRRGPGRVWSHDRCGRCGKRRQSRAGRERAGRRLRRRRAQRHTGRGSGRCGEDNRFRRS